MINWTTSFAVMFILLYAQSLLEQRKLRRQRDEWEELCRRYSDVLNRCKAESDNALNEANQLIEILRKGTPSQ